MVNDLDVRLIDSVTGTVFRPYVLNPASPASAATNGDNIRDNVEKILNSSQINGRKYFVVISHKSTLSAPQKYSVIVSGASSINGSIPPATPTWCSYASPITLPAVINSTTVGGIDSANNYLCNTWNETGPEKLYKFTVTTAGTLTASLSNLGANDLDIVLLGGCSPTQCLNIQNSSISAFSITTPGTYYLVVDGYNGAEGSFTLSATFTPASCTAPAITTQPTAQTACTGGSTTFTVAATGTALSYQWKRGTTNVGTNSPTLTLTNVSLANAGSYSVVVTGTCGTITSNAVNLTVNPSTIIGTHPATQTACTGGSATFTVAATGTALSYQWKRGTTNVGTNSPTLTLTNVSAAQAGSYTVVLTGTCGTVTSNAVALTLGNANIVSIDKNICSGEVCMFRGMPLISAGLYSDTGFGALGQCDTIFNLNLTYSHISDTIFISLTLLVATDTSANSYTWYNCSTGDSVASGRFFSNPVFGTYYRVKIEKGCCTKFADCFWFGEVSVRKHNDSDIRIYPNPASNRVIIETGSVDPVRVVMFDIAGKVIFDQRIIQKSEKDISDLPKGLYLVKFDLESGTTIQKLVIE